MIMKYHFPYIIIDKKGGNMVAERIKSLREASGISQAKLAKQLGVTRSSVNAWELSISSPTTQYIVDMAQLFHVSTDYILGVSNEKQLSLRGMDDEETKLVYDLVNYILKQKGTSPTST